jgi:hypothetical protein
VVVVVVVVEVVVVVVVVAVEVVVVVGLPQHCLMHSNIFPPFFRHSK